MSTTQQLTAQARALSAGRTTAQLVNDWIVADEIDMKTLKRDDMLAMAQVREWLMDALEARNPEAFALWLETPEMTNDDLRSFYGV